MKLTDYLFRKRFVLLLLFVLGSQVAFTQTTFVGFKSTGWKYRTANQEPATFGNGTWKTNAYSDAAWASGQATLGYDDGAPNHTINTWVWPYSASRTGNNSAKTHYFRKTFNVGNPNDYSSYKIKTWCDDGLVVYLNNKEVYRLNMPAGAVDSLTSASMAPANDSIYGEVTINLPNDLLPGANVIAVEVHQSGVSLDRYFDLSIEGTLGGIPTYPEWPVTFKSTNWRYRTANQEPATFGNGTWKTNAYSDAAWASGQATLGYDDGTPTHTINTWVWPYSASRTGNNSAKTHYFRKSFNITNPALFSGYQIKTWCDDGLVVYLNNKEVYRLNMPASSVDSLTSALMAPANDSIYGQITINLPNDLLPGTNVIAVEVHQSGVSLDRYFDLSIEGIPISNCPEWPVAFKSTGWKYRTADQEPATFGNGTWKTNAYNDAAWLSGQATLGYDDGTPTHTINTWLWPLNPSRTGNNSARTHYFRKCFNVANKNLYTGYRIKTWCDDGLVVYLNNKEVYRLNMPAGAIDSLTSASTAPANDSIYGETTIFLPNDLLDGPNVIAVEVHQAASSLDRYFDLSIEGVTTPCGVTLTRQPYLQLSTPTSMTVRWRTNAAIIGRVKYGTSMGGLTQFVDDSAPTTEHVITLTGLTPNQLYYYSVGCTDGTAIQGDANNYFKTPPTDTERPLRFWLFGDSGKTSTSRQTQTRQAYLNYLGNNYVDGVLLMGDIALREDYATEPGDGTDGILQQKFFNQMGDVLKKFPSWTTFGNHDYHGFPDPNNPGDSTLAFHLTDAAIFNSFSFPSSVADGISSDKNYYSFDVGNVHFVQINPYYIPSATYGGPSIATTADTVTGNLINWLKKDLAATQKLWKIVFFHIPPYSKVKHDSDTDNMLINVRRSLVPILERYKVDLVLSGHSHGMQRSKLINGVFDPGIPAPSSIIQSQSARYPASAPYTKNSGEKGTVYIVNSDGGQGQNSSEVYDYDLPPSPHPVMYYTTTERLGGSSELRIFKNRIDFVGIKQDGSKPDSFTIMKDVNKKITYNTPAPPLILTASWEGNYSWKILGGGSLPNTTKSITVAPSANTTYIVNDGYNGGNGFLADTFIVNVCTPTITLTSTISTSTVYRASQWIKGSNTNIIAPSATVEYHAGYIELKPSGTGTAFLATPSSGHYFLAVPDGCAPGGGGGESNNNAQGQESSNKALLPSSSASSKLQKREPKR
jgi:hypothetical protein